MTRPRSREIDELAKNMLITALKGKWEVREQLPDYRIDYTIEPFDSCESTGLFFNIQLKGKEKATFTRNGEFITFSLETKHLAYYIDKVPLPMYLVVIDVGKKQGWWVFLQQFAREQLAKKQWRKQKTVTVRIPATNQLNNLSDLLHSVRDAYQFMRNLNPGAVDAAIHAEKERLKKLDPRFNPNIEIANGKTNIQLQPKEDIPLKLTFSGGDAVEKLKKFVEFGIEVEFETGELKIEGSPLFEEMGEPHSLQNDRGLNASIRLAVIKNKLELTNLEFPGTIIGGTIGGTFKGTLPDAPMSLCMPFYRREQKSELQLSFDVKKWCGQPIRLLGYLEPLLKFYDAISISNIAEDKMKIRIDFFVRGNYISSGISDQEFPKCVKIFEFLVHEIDRARSVAHYFGLNSLVPNDFFEKNHEQYLHEIDVLYALITKGEHEVSAPNAIFKVTMLADEMKSFLKQTIPRKRSMPVSVPYNQPFPFLGTTLSLTGVQQELTSVLLKTKRNKLRDELRFGKLKEYTAEFHATKSNKYVLKQIADLRLSPAA